MKEKQSKDLFEILISAIERTRKNKVISSPIDADVRLLPFTAASKKHSPFSKKIGPEKSADGAIFISFLFSDLSIDLFAMLEFKKGDGSIPLYYNDRDDKVIEELVNISINKLQPIKQQIKSYGINYQFLKEGCRYVCRREILRFRNDYKQKYEKKMREKIDDTIKKAKNRNSDALFKLIAWDKGWLYEDWVKEWIMSAQGTNDKDFLKLLGSNVAKEPGFYDKTMHAQWLTHFRCLRDCGIVFDSELTRELVDYFADNDKSFPQEFCDLDYFRKFLGRHGLI